VVTQAGVVVVGGGIAGASAAWALAADRAVVLVEREAQPGMHATGRSAAMLNETSGPPAVCRLATESRPFFERPPNGFCEHPLLSPRGVLWVGEAGTSDVLGSLAARAPHAARVLTTDEVRTLVPNVAAAACAAGGVHEPGAESMDVAAILAGFLRLFRQRGGELYTTSEAIQARREHGSWIVTAGEHVLRCAAVVNAGGAWADEFARRAGVRPVGLQPMRRTAALVSAPEFTARWPMVMEASGRWYARPESGGLLISPCDETPSFALDARPDEVDVALAIERVNDALGLAISTVRRAWAGLRTFAPDRLPVVGPDPDEPAFIWLAGQGGAGIKTSPALARIVADAIIDGRAVPPEFDPGRFR
jgi:D-arginine dehydrogenase